jgi:hypothetical protein
MQHPPPDHAFIWGYRGMEGTVSKLTYNGHTHTIEIFDDKGASLGKWTAYNNIDHAFAKAHYDSLTHLKNGSYPVQDRQFPHSHAADANGSYGLHGIIRFNYPGHSGVGLHSGRANAKHMPGAQHATHGCIRTTDEAMAAIKIIIAKDPLKNMTVQANNAHAVSHGKVKQPHAHGKLHNAHHGSHHGSHSSHSR